MNNDWRSRAACRGLDPDLFHPTPETVASDKAQMNTTCLGCPVRFDCLNHALEAKEDHGQWGGYSASARDKILKRERRSRIQSAEETREAA